MSILAKIKSWFVGGTTKEADDADLAPYKMEPPTLELQETAIFAATPDWPFPTTKPEDGGVAKVAEAKPAKKPRAPAKTKPKAVKAKPAASTKAKASAKPKAEVKPKAAPKTKAKKS